MAILIGIFCYTGETVYVVIIALQFVIDMALNCLFYYLLFRMKLIQEIMEYNIQINKSEMGTK